MEAAAVQAARREGPTVEAEARARMERTENMLIMSVTLDVSKLSGWLNEDVHCREKRGGGAYEEGRQAGKQAGGWGGVVVGASSKDAPTVEAEGTARTANMEEMSVTLDVSKLSGSLNADAHANMCVMSVTLDVSKLSGWLNADACRVKRGSRGGGATCGQAGGRVGRGGRWRKQQGGPDCGG